MGRKKIQIKQIPESRNKSVTFLKRKAGLIKKAWELSVLCSADVAVIIFGENGKAFEFCSCDIDDVLVRYTEYPGIVEKKPASELAAAAAKDAGEDPPDASDEDESGSETTGPKSKTSKGRQIASNLAAKRAGLPVGNAKGTPPPQLVPNLPSVNLTKNASASSSGARQTPNVRAAAGSTSNGQPSLAQFQGPSTAPPGSNGAAYYQTSRWQQAQQGQSGAPLPGQYAQSLGPGGHWDQQQQGRQGENGLRLDIPPNTFGSSSPQGAGFPFSPMFRNYNSSQLGLDGSTSQPPTLGFPANGGNPLLGNGTGTGGLSFDPASASNGNQNPLGFLLNGDRSVYGASNSIPNLGLNTFAGTDLLGSMFGNPMLNFGGLFGGTNPGAFNGQQQQQQPQQQQQHALYNHPMFANYNSQLNGGDAIGQQQQQQQQPQQGQPPPSSQAGVPHRSASMPSAGGFSWPQASSSSTTQPTSNLGHSSSGGGLATFPEGAGNGVLGGDEHDTPTSALEDGPLGGSSYGGLPTGLAEEGEERKRSASVSSTASDEDVNKRARLE